MKKIVAIASLCLPLLAMSQSPPTPPSAGAGGDLASVHEQLALQPTQEAAWQKYEAAVNAYIALHYQERPVLASHDDAAPAQIRRLVDLHSHRLAALEDIESAAKSFYATLTAAQQKQANQTLLASIPVIGGVPPRGSPTAEKSGKPEGRGHRGGGPGGPGGGMGGMGR